MLVTWSKRGENVHFMMDLSDEDMYALISDLCRLRTADKRTIQLIDRIDEIHAAINGGVVPRK
jgi:hypothetical protein